MVLIQVNRERESNLYVYIYIHLRTLYFIPKKNHTFHAPHTHEKYCLLHEKCVYHTRLFCFSFLRAVKATRKHMLRIIIAQARFSSKCHALKILTFKNRATGQYFHLLYAGSGVLDLMMHFHSIRERHLPHHCPSNLQDRQQ